MDSNIILYTTDSGDVNVQVQYEDGTFWLTQKRMAELFGVETNTINYHLKEIFRSEELNEDSVVRKIRITAADGKNYATNFYHLGAIIAVGYRVNSKTRYTPQILIKRLNDSKKNSREANPHPPRGESIYPDGTRSPLKRNSSNEMR